MERHPPPYVCPATGDALRFESDPAATAPAPGGHFVTAAGRTYALRHGFPDFTFPPTLADPDERSRVSYDRDIDIYEANVAMMFEMFGADEEKVRNGVIDMLDLSPDSCVLETGAGTGRNTVLIRNRLGAAGSLCYQDLAAGALCRARGKLLAREGDGPAISGHVGNASYLPFPDGVFDAYFHAGGINTFAEIGRAFGEAARVTRRGGRVVFADETMPEWLLGTEFARVLLHSNPLHRCPVPLRHVPVQARDVSLHWLLGGAYYALAFTVGEGEPFADFDLPIAGPRGGTLRTRYFGQLEGVTPQARTLALAARAKRGLSMHEWLDSVVTEAALRDLDEGPAEDSAPRAG